MAANVRFLHRSKGSCDVALVRDTKGSDGTVMYVQCPLKGGTGVDYDKLADTEKAKIASALLTETYVNDLTGTKFMVCPLHTDNPRSDGVLLLPWSQVTDGVGRNDGETAPANSTRQDTSTYQREAKEAETKAEDNMRNRLQAELEGGTVYSPSLQRILAAGVKYAASPLVANVVASSKSASSLSRASPDVAADIHRSPGIRHCVCPICPVLCAYLYGGCLCTVGPGPKRTSSHTVSAACPCQPVTL
jgi:hypothetical protein